MSDPGLEGRFMLLCSGLLSQDTGEKAAAEKTAAEKNTEKAAEKRSGEKLADKFAAAFQLLPDCDLNADI